MGGVGEGGDSFVIKRRGVIEANTIKMLMTGAWEPVGQGSTLIQKLTGSC